MITAYMQQWLDNPDGGGRFPVQRDAIRAHDQTCTSLNSAWLPRAGGHSCLSDLTECDGDCGITFFNEGLVPGFEDCPDVWHWYCRCCLAKATTCSCTDNQEKKR